MAPLLRWWTAVRLSDFNILPCKTSAYITQWSPHSILSFTEASNHANDSGIIVKSNVDKEFLYKIGDVSYSEVDTTRYVENSLAQQAFLRASDAVAWNYGASSVSVYKDYAIIGAYQESDAHTQGGAAYIFKK